jgi:hypothetical protein
LAKLIGPMVAGTCRGIVSRATSRTARRYPKHTLHRLRVAHREPDLVVPFVELLAVRVELGYGHLLSGRQVDRVHRLELAPVLRDALPDERSRLVLDQVVKLNRLDRRTGGPEGVNRRFCLLVL